MTQSSPNREFREESSVPSQQKDMIQSSPNREFREEVSVSGHELLTRVKELLHESNVRRIIIKHEGQTIMEIPLTVGVVGVLFAPTLAALGAVSALLSQSSIEIVRVEQTDQVGGYEELPGIPPDTGFPSGNGCPCSNCTYVWNQRSSDDLPPQDCPECGARLNC